MSVKVRETRERKERDNVLRNKTPYRSSDGGTERGGGGNGVGPIKVQI